MGLNLTGLTATRTIGDVITGARGLLNDTEPDTSGVAGSSWSGTRVVSGRTLGALVAEVRGLISDVIDVTDGAFRYSDADLYMYVSDALATLRSERPDVFFNLSGGIPVYTALDAAVRFPVQDGFWPAVLFYAAATAEMRDDTWAQSGKGPALLKSFADGILLPPYRHADVDLYQYASDALAEARRLRPDMFLGFGLRGRALPAYTPADAATLFPLDERYYTAFVSYVAGMAKASDTDLKADSPAALYLTSFAAALGG